MGLPAQGGSAARIIDELDPLYTEIADLLGQLAGNEAFWATLEADMASTFPEHGSPPPPPKGCTVHSEWFTMPGDHGFGFQHGFWAAGAPTEGMPTPQQSYEDLRDAATRAWHRAHDLYANAGYGGAAAGFRAWGRNVWEPDPATMSLSVDELGGLVTWLHRQIPAGAGWVAPDDPSAPQWLAALRQGWPATSRASDSFYDFWNDVGDKCAIYVDLGARLVATAAQVTATVGDYQRNLLEVTKKTRDHVRTALEQWHQWKRPSGAWPNGKTESHDGVKTILGYVSYGTGVIAMFPPAAVVSGTISVATGGLSYLIPSQTIDMEATAAQTADEIWNGYGTDVATVCDNMSKVLDMLQTTPPPGGVDGGLASGGESLAQFVKEAQSSRRDWSPPAVQL